MIFEASSPFPIVFFGSGPVAAASLEYLASHLPSTGVRIEAVITKRNRSRAPFAPVENVAGAHSLPLLYADKRAEVDTLLAEHNLASTCAILVDYGVIISGKAIDRFERGILNSHFSLLPRWRGADPITFAVLEGDSESGVSLMFINENLDDGLLLNQEVCPLDPRETTSSLTTKLVALSNKMLVRDFPKYLTGELTPYPQPKNGGDAYRSRQLTKEDGLLDWHKPAVVLERQIRAFDQWPKSYTMLNGLSLTITEAAVVDRSGVPGTAVVENKQLVVHCGEDALSIQKLKPANRGEMDIAGFLAGYGKHFQNP